MLDYMLWCDNNVNLLGNLYSMQWYAVNDMFYFGEINLLLTVCTI